MSHFHLRSTRYKTTLLFVVIPIALASVGCDRSPKSSESTSSQSNQPSPPPPKPTAASSGYAELAANLADPFLTDRSQQPLKKELAQLFAEANVKVVRYRTSSANSPMLQRISQEAADSGAELVRSQQSLESLSQDDGVSAILVGLLGLYLGDPTTVVTGASQILAKGDAVQQERIRWASAFNRSRAAQLMLPAAAGDYAGPTLPIQPLVIDFDESFAGSANHDLISLTNTTGTSLTNCTVLVELRGKAGDVRQNVHFVSSWAQGNVKYARYGIGVEADSGKYGSRTVYGVQELHVSVWADEGRQESMLYRYVGAERNKDVRAMLEGKMHVKYYYNADPFLSNYPEVDLFLSEVPLIPAHRVSLTFFGPTKTGTADPVSFTWEQPEWSQNQRRRFGLGKKLPFEPKKLEIQINFDQIDYVFKREVSLSDK